MNDKIEEQLQYIIQKLELLLVSQKEVFSICEAAEYLKITKSTLYKYTSAGNIAHYKPNGKLILFKKEDIDAWLNKSRIPSNNELNSFHYELVDYKT